MTNLLLIMADQQRFDSLGCTGNAVVKTPHLDGLGQTSASMTRHFTPNQICSPSRGSLFSGLYPRHHGLTRNGIALPPSHELISHCLATAGYRCHGVGKFHFQPILAGAEMKMPDSYAFWDDPRNCDWQGPFFGFQTADILIGESAVVTRGGPYAQWLDRVNPQARDLYLPENALSTPPDDLDEIWRCAVPDDLHYNRWIANRACNFLDSLDTEEPFFLFASFPDPHHPFSPPAPWCDLYAPEEVPLPLVRDGELAAMPRYVAEAAVPPANRKNDATYMDMLLHPVEPQEQGSMGGTGHFSEATLRKVIAYTYGMVSMIDDCVGQILSKIEANGRRDDTIVVFTSDHGEFLGDHGLLRKGPPPYRQILQTPLLLSGPGIQQGQHDALTSHIDLKATLLELLQVDGRPGDGTSFAPLLKGDSYNAKDHLLAEYHARVRPETYNHSIITRQHRLTIYPNQKDWGELFDLATDPSEQQNLYDDGAQADVVKRLSDQLAKEFPPRPDAGGEVLAIY